MSITNSNHDLGFATPVFPVRRFSVDEYHRMVDSNVLTEDDQVELLEGWIVPKMVRRPRYDATIELIESALRQLIPQGYRLRIQSAITTTDSEPEPDLALVKGDARDHIERHPSAAEVSLVVEVADTSLERDREKRRIYARAEIPQYWIVNLVERQIEVYSQPSGKETDSSYTREIVLLPEQSLDVTIVDDMSVNLPVDQLLP